MASRHWGPHFPDAALAGVKHWSLHFPDGGQDPADFAGFGPPGSATLALNLESLQLNLNWATDVIGVTSGREQRIAYLDAPKQTLRGNAYLTGSNPRHWRSVLAKYMATGATFLIGLPHEELIFQAAANGNVLTVDAAHLAICDWAFTGQRCVVVTADGAQSIDCVIQADGDGSTIVIDKTLTGALARYGSRIMPALACLLDPQQSIARHAPSDNPVELWSVSAVASIFDFAPKLARINFGSESPNPALAGVIAFARRFGEAGLRSKFSVNINGSWPAHGQLVENGLETTWRANPGVTTIGDLEAALLVSNNFKLSGVYNPADTFELTDLISAFAVGGASVGSVGRGAVLTTYAGDGTDRPVWDRFIQIQDTGTDEIQALTEILDLGGVPYAIGSADQPHWGRAITIRRTTRAEWQWFKLFMWTVRGSQQAFWLPSWRNDLPFVSKAPNTITIRNDTGADVATWFPAQRQHVQIVEASGVVTRAKITAAVNNGDGTYTLTIGTTLASSSVLMVSWLELSRFENPAFDLTFSANKFELPAKARVVPA